MGGFNLFCFFSLEITTKNVGYSSVFLSGVFFLKKKAAIGTSPATFRRVYNEYVKRKRNIVMDIMNLLQEKEAGVLVELIVVYDKAYRHKDGSYVTSTAAHKIVSIIYIHPIANLKIKIKNRL